MIPSDSTAGVRPIPVAPRHSVIPFDKKVLIATPWQKQVHPITAFCVGQLSDRRRTANALHYGDAFVTHSRNTCADVFLGTDSEWMLMIDDDMVVPFGDAGWYKHFTGFEFDDKFLGFNALDRLMSHGKTLVGALYFGRQKHSSKPVYNEGMSNVDEANYARRGPHDLCKPTRWVGTGCMLVHRSVFLDIEKKFPILARKDKTGGGNWFTSTEASMLEYVIRIRDGLQGKALTGEHAYHTLEALEGLLAVCRYENPLGVGEDVSFCLRAQACGHTPHVDMGLRCGHIGHWIF